MNQQAKFAKKQPDFEPFLGGRKHRPWEKVSPQKQTVMADHREMRVWEDEEFMASCLQEKRVVTYGHLVLTPLLSDDEREYTCEDCA